MGNDDSQLLFLYQCRMYESNDIYRYLCYV